MAITPRLNRHREVTFVLIINDNCHNINCLLYLHLSSKMVLVSYPERGILGVNCTDSELRDVPRGKKKADRYPLARQNFYL